ncbi:ABC multidrug transporter A-2 [Penicillium cosmopolitanum]|uniref:ABC multidrug transporter A-2 n=1 Tax=Penicillium cosmopolitanum TaxID=1131564 RepID=A0A9W9W6S4_9EURO|nr:ABC multidrug transporter A-2 [Penicillium cosmopolitanum]KAJ5404505.1 ABC multidrug transporter A-2 [Penicillium cosmopolitanum]
MAAHQPPAPATSEHDAATTHIISHHAEEYTTSDEVSEEDTPTPAVEDETRHKDITTIARSFSNLSQKPSSVNSQNDPINTFLDPTQDASLDPNSDQFSSLKWVRNMLQMTRDSDRYPKRTAGVSFRNLNVFGYGSGADYQITFGNAWLKMFNWAKARVGYGKKVRIDILRDFEGMVHAGEMLVVLGRPGSGCTTLLKTIAGETHGLYIDDGADVQYQGISWDEMHSRFRGEVIYQAETEIHFPQLSFALHKRDVVMAMLGLSHTMNTKVGNEYIRGVSGGERKRVSIAEITLCGSPLQCWDNSTRGLDSSTALEFVKNIRLSTQYSGATAVVAIYQASQSIYDVFDKAVVLYEGRQIYFGKSTDARRFFIDMGFECPDRQTDADFLTSLSSPSERRVRPGFEHLVPRTADEFAKRWKESEERKHLLQEIQTQHDQYPLKGDQFDAFSRSRAAEKSKANRASSPYTISYYMQARLCLWRGFLRLQGDMSMTIASVIGNSVLGVIISTVFLNLENNTDSFFQRGALLFFAILMNAFASSLELLTLWQQRPIVEKHYKYALYHPSAEAIGSYIVELPSKVMIAIAFNIIIYFVPHLRRTAGHFFIFFLFSFSTTLVMSNIFRSIGAISRSMAQAMVPASIFMMILVIYTGFTIPVRDMHPWFRWLNYLNPIAYAFEGLIVNEFSGRHFPCSTYIPSGGSYDSAPQGSRICSQKGAFAGDNYIDGDTYINTTFNYYKQHLWRNFGILVAFFFGFLAIYVVSSEYIRAKPSKGEVLVFPRGKIPAFAKKARQEDSEAAPSTEKHEIVDKESDGAAAIIKQTAIFHWEEVCYDIKIKGENRRILDRVDGWVKPGTLTALMGVTGAGKTSLLDVLANRVTMGVITGDMLVDGRPRDGSFQRKTGYVQQQDLHLETSTVREALVFSALLRQPSNIPYAEKIAYVEEVIKMLGMEEYAEAVVGVLGEGLNVEQRKRLTIGVEIAAKPDLLLFFDEPTSGLDSQTAWSICSLMRKLADHGQAVLCTIHQPSAMLMSQFDRLLFLAKGGRTVYFGDLGPRMQTLIKYFENKGSIDCPKNANPAEWMLEVIGAAPGSHADRDWAEVWLESPERAQVKQELADMKSELRQKPVPPPTAGYGEFATPLWYQFLICIRRMFQQYYRSPGYLYSKTAMCVFPPIFIGFTFWRMPNTQQGLQNQMFAIFMLLVIFPNLVQQMMPSFCTQRSLYEVRERPSKAYSWKSFMLASIFVELPWNIIMALPVYFSWYYPIGLYRNAPAGEVTDRGGTMFLLILIFLMFTSTFSSMIIAGIEQPETGSNIAQLMFSLCLIFNGVLASPAKLGKFWIFMYRVSPFTYLVSAVLSTGLSGSDATCSDIELLKVDPPTGQTCIEYLGEYAEFAQAKVFNGNATSGCEICSITNADQFLLQLNIKFSDHWRNIGLLFVYIGVNILGALLLYWLARVPKKWSRKVKEE